MGWGANTKCATFTPETLGFTSSLWLGSGNKGYLVKVREIVLLNVNKHIVSDVTVTTSGYYTIITNTYIH